MVNTPLHSKRQGHTTPLSEPILILTLLDLRSLTISMSQMVWSPAWGLEHWPSRILVTQELQMLTTLPTTTSLPTVLVMLLQTLNFRLSKFKTLLVRCFQVTPKVGLQLRMMIPITKLTSQLLLKLTITLRLLLKISWMVLPLAQQT